MSIVIAAQLLLVLHSVPPKASLALTSRSVERVVLPAGARFTVTTNGLAATVELRSSLEGAAVVTALRDLKASLCPRAESHGHVVVLHCLTHRFSASLTGNAGSQALVLKELRGLPWTGPADSPLSAVYPPEAVGLGGACPGTTAAGRGECARAAGREPEAIAAFTEALSTPEASMGALRLGDLALFVHDDPVAAAEWYQRAGPHGPFGRVAESRLCELTGSCLRPSFLGSVFDSGGLPEPLRSEIEIRAVRALVFMENTPQALVNFSKRFTQGTRANLCAQAHTLCLALVTEGLRSDELRTSSIALDLFLRLRSPQSHAPEEFAMNDAAADASAALGAPAFAANLSASMTADIGPDDLPSHLLRTANFYLDAGDRLRAGVIADFARGRLGKKEIKSPAWQQILAAAAFQRLDERPLPWAPDALVSIHDEQTRAEQLLTRSRDAFALETP